jgi:hypothetical protein
VRSQYVLHPEGSPEAEAFVYQRAERILNGQVSQVVKGLRQIVTKRRLTGTMAKTLSDVAGYYYRNRERMRYDLYLQHGWPIASGTVEGACKNLIRDRFERSDNALDPTDRRSATTLPRRLPLPPIRHLLGIPRPTGPATSIPQGRLAGRSKVATPKSGVIPTPLQAPNANAHIERWIGSARRECLDRPLILSQRQLNRVLRVYVRHDNQQRPHRALDPQAPDPGSTPSVTGRPAGSAMAPRRRDLLGGLIHEYEAAAA